MEEFKTILQDSCSEIEEKKSRFIANIFYVKDLEEVEQRLKEVRTKYFDASHHCYAFRVEQENMIKEKQSDDGEPAGTAGLPMLNILQKNELVNVLVIVTRYFGGTLLGTGGLVRAYSLAVQKALETANMTIQKMGYVMKVKIEYKELEKFKYYCKKNEIKIIDLQYEDNIFCTIEINSQEKDKLIGKNKQDVNILEYAVLEQKYIKTNR